MFSRTLAFLIVFACLVFAEQQVPKQMREAVITERLGARVDPSLIFQNERGEDVTLGSVLNQEKPVLLQLGYYACPMLCGMVMNGMLEGMKNLDWVPGREYEVLSISIAHEEGAELARAKKKNYMARLEMPGAEEGWHFWTGDKNAIQSLTDTVGFGFQRDPETGEYAHAAGIMMLSPDGVVSRYLYGIEYKPRDLKLGLLDASEGKQASVTDKILMVCYRYDPDSKGYVLFAENTMRYSGYAVVVFLAVFLGRFWIKEYRKAKAHA